MVERKVTSTKKDSSGNIIGVCNKGEWWSPRNTYDIINDIEMKLYKYYVIVDGQKVFITVINGSTGKYLRTDPDKTTRNNLDDLPDC
jgi:hypothetical protein